MGMVLALLAVPHLCGATAEELGALKAKAESGDDSALCELVERAGRDDGGLTDRECVRFCTLAAGKNNADAQVLLYAFFSQGKHVQANREMAAVWEEGIMNSGEAAAIFKLGKWKLEHGAGEAERQSGKTLCEKAADMGLAEAKAMLRELADKMAEEAKASALREARAHGALSNGRLIEKVHSYLAARTNGDSYGMRAAFAASVHYKYCGKKNVSRDAVIKDIQAGWERWVSRSYSLQSIGVRDNVVEVTFFYDLYDANGKNAYGYSKEVWTLNNDGEITDWDERLSKQTAPSVSPGFDIIN